ncbi:MIF4G domain-containing protein [Actinidia rufa]|uniref:MIF4G domain-containing protein n=1 Tax=Actinidia rufa TaxID=165716 RepID=A0A7J0HC50_9ERIC|nr:MIF4G domain-containing protein [Actinidia rufa]
MARKLVTVIRRIRGRTIVDRRTIAIHQVRISRSKIEGENGRSGMGAPMCREKEPKLLAAVKFIAHLVNRKVVRELVALDDRVEIAVVFVTSAPDDCMVCFPLQISIRSGPHQENFDKSFLQQCSMIRRLETNNLLNAAKIFFSFTRDRCSSLACCGLYVLSWTLRNLPVFSSRFSFR